MADLLTNSVVSLNMYIYILSEMRNPSSLLAAKSQIVAFFKDLPSNSFGLSELKNYLFDNKTKLKLATSTSPKKFIEFLTQERILQLAEIRFPYKRFIRYVKPECSVLDLAASLIKGAYFSHYSAIHVHDLSEQLPKTIYINSEQGKKTHTRVVLKQRNIDVAFSRPWRTSNNIAQYKDYNIYWLNGMYTGNLGVIQIPYQDAHNILVTDIERTLIDIAVRPVYSGGIFEVLKAYKAAIPKVDLGKLLGYLRQIGFMYPYHQAIGFYLEKAGLPSHRTEALKSFGLSYDFYLTHQIKSKGYSQDWKLYYPSGF